MARIKKPVGEIAAFRAALGAVRGRTGRSPLYRWLRANHDQFLEDWTEAADWPAFSEAFARLGLTDRTGKPPLPDTARKTWLQVRKDVAKAKTRQMSKRGHSLAPDEIAPGVRAVETPARKVDDAPRPRMTLDIRPARPRLDMAAERSPSQLSTAAPPSPPPRPVVGDEDADAQIRRVLDEIDGAKVPIPKKI